MRPLFGKPQATRVVILGGGYVTIHGYKSLEKKLGKQMRDGSVEVTVVCPRSYHVFHGWTGEFFGGIVDLPNKHSDLRTVMPLARHVCGEAVAVDLQRRTVKVRVVGDGVEEELPYHHLLIGTGSYDAMERVPGLEEHGMPLKGIGEVLAVRNRLLTNLAAADSVTDPKLQQRYLTIVIAGGGFAGVEMCAAMAELIHALKDRYPVLRKRRPRVVLVHSGEGLLPQWRPRYDKLADYATEQLNEWGVDIRLSTRLEAVTEEGARLSDGELIPSALVLSTVGMKLEVMPGTEQLPRAPDGRLMADEFNRVKGEANVWVGGDAAHLIHPRTRVACPPNALWAIKHGDWVGHNIGATILGRSMKPFTYPGLGQVASLGIGKGASELYGMQLTGWLAWISRFSFFMWFMPDAMNSVRVVIDWLMLPLAGRRTIPFFDGTPQLRTAAAQSHPGHLHAVGSR
ncbi:MAG TPA: FAD-dependent oxidoreductase [Myxococcaceae bacterium]|jgi:NADH dehydrogenase